ncbi:MAG TPA: DUF2079 domain-containing protein [Streptosporangiaceae bacterium]|nr:DUF2079 domain-containing protein [Streptosporangiaceae bacterium]
MLQEHEVETSSAVRLPSVYRDSVTWAIVVVAFGAYTVISLFRLLQLDPSSWDLGIFTEYVKQYAHFHAPIVDIRGAGTNLWGDHFSPAVAAVAPFFRVFPSAGTLLVAQALLVAASVFPVAQGARALTGVGPARAIALAYGFCWGLQQMINFDFHEIAIAVPLLAFALSALIEGRVRATVCWALPLVFVKEDQGFTVAAIGFYLLMSGLRTEVSDRAKARAGIILMLWGVAWSFLAIAVIIPHFNASHTYYYWGDGGAFAPGGHPSVGALISQFFHAWPQKLETLVLLLLPTAFLALRSPVALIALPSLGLRFESTNSAYWGTAWHYNATVMPILFVAAIDGLVRLRASRDDAGATWEAWANGQLGWRRAALAGAERYGVAMMVAVTVPFAFQYPLSGLWSGQTYRISPHVAADNAAMAEVPDGASVLTTLNMLASLGARTDTYWIGNRGNPDTEYIVFDGPDSGYSTPIANVPSFIASLYPGNVYTQIFADNGVYVFRRTTQASRLGLLLE